MATKYLIHGATFNGDGTATNEAASAGAAGAWNHIDIIAGTAVGFGTLAAGDTVYIRSKSGNGVNANIVYTPGAAASYGLAAATLASPVTWILDNGAIWSGIDGTLTLTASTSAMTQTMRNYNNFTSLTPYNFIVENTGTNLTFSQLVIGLCNTNGLKIKQINVTNAGFSNGFAGNHENLWFVVNTVCTGYGVIFNTNSKVLFINPIFEVLTAPAATQPFLTFAGSHCRYEIRGGQMIGTGVNSGLVSLFLLSTFSSWTGNLQAIGFQVPKVVPLAQPGVVFPGSAINMSGMDGGSGGAFVSDWGSSDSRNITNNYPTLNATLADSANTPSSWRIYPKYASKFSSFELPISKLFTGTAAVKTLTTHFLATTGWAGVALDTGSVWVTINYIDDSTGLPVTQTTRARVPAALTTSGLTWSPSNAWGAVSLTAYKIEITTNTSVKKDTAITISLMGSATSGNTNDIFICDPDVQIS